MNPIGSDAVGAPPARATTAPVPRPLGAARSIIFFAIYACYVLLVMGLGQRLIIWPLITIFPRRRRSILRYWFQHTARATLRLARLLADVRVAVTGSIPPEPVVVIMNHQSVLDIPLGVSLMPGPYPLIPTRDRYAHGVPGMSFLIRIARYPLVSQRPSASRAELASLLAAAESVAGGDNSLLIFPEGHRTHDGRISPFMGGGLKIILNRARRPVYCCVVDGLWHARTAIDGLKSFTGTRARVRILGPFVTPPRAELDSFIESLRDRMTDALAEMRLATDLQSDRAAARPA